MKKLLFGLEICAVMVAWIIVWTLLPWFVILALAVVLALWLAITRSGHRTISVTQVGLSTFTGRLGSAAVIVIGIAGVVGVLVALLAMGDGLRATLRQTGNDDTAIVMRSGSGAETNSVLTRDDINTIEEAPGIARDKGGKPIASVGFLTITSVPKKSDAAIDAYVQIHGVSGEAWRVYPKVKIIAGRKFKPGLRELDVGNSAQRQFVGLEIGKQLKLAGQEWTIVGVFASGDSQESELWGDEKLLASAFRRDGIANAVTVRLTTPAAFDKFRAALMSNPSLNVDTFTTRDYFNKQSERISKIIRIVGITIGVIMAIGAIFGALNTTYTAVVKRVREIATLRAVGFSGTSVVVSILIETMLLALIGGVVGAAIAWLIFHGYTASTIGSNSGQVVFEFKMPPALLWNGIKWALAIGFIGGLFPAANIARLSVATALRKV